MLHPSLVAVRRCVVGICMGSSRGFPGKENGGCNSAGAEERAQQLVTIERPHPECSRKF